MIDVIDESEAEEGLGYVTLDKLKARLTSPAWHPYLCDADS